MGNTILIAEDFAPTLKMLAKLFGTAGFTVYQSQTCLETVKLASQHLPDCFLLDSHLSDGPIPIVCSFIRSHGVLKNAPIVIHSSHSDEIEHSYATCQADAFLEKGTGTGALLAAMNHHLRRMELERKILKKDDLCLCGRDLCVLRDSKQAATLSAEQFKLLSLLIEKSPAFVSEEEICLHMSGPEYADNKPDTIKPLAQRLRQRLGWQLGRRIRSMKSRGWIYLSPRRMRADPAPGPAEHSTLSTTQKNQVW